MKKTLLSFLCKVWIISILAIPLSSYSQEFASRYANQSEKQEVNQKQSLKEVFDQLKTKYHVSFVYESDVLKDKYVKKEDVSLEKLDEYLSKVLIPHGLKFEKQSNYYIIIPAKSRNNTLKQLERKDVGNTLSENNQKSALNSLERYGTQEFIMKREFPVRGQVTSGEDTQPMPGVNVLVKGTTVGTITDADGNFSLTAPDGNATLVFSFIGFTTEEVGIGGKSIINVSLEPDIAQLSEVVVVGYSTQQKKDITGAVSVIDGEQMRKTPAPSFAQQLQGRAAGVQIGSSGAPNANTMIRIRGIGSVNDNSPLIVIDGVSTKSQDFNSINPNDIESIQVLKDASASSIYGAQASNGVIIITTKKGTKGGGTRITYDGYVGVQENSNWYDMMNTEQYSEYLRTSLENNVRLRGLDQDPEYKEPVHKHFGPLSNWNIPSRLSETTPISTGTDWGEEMFQTGVVHNHQLSALGGGESGNYAFGINYYTNEGTLINTSFDRYTLRANTEFKARKNIRVGENLMFTYTQDRDITNNDEGNTISMAYRMVPYIPVYDDAGKFAGTGVGESGNAQNPVAMSERGKDNQRRRQRLFGNIYAEVDIRDITLRSSFGIDYRNEFRYAMTKLNPEFSEKRATNEFVEAANYNYRWVFSNTATYNKTFSEIHKLTALVGTEAIKDGIGRSLEGIRQNYFYEDNLDTWTLNQGSANGLRNSGTTNGEFSLFGIFGRIDYSLHNKYLLTGIIRRDGVSRFQGDNRYGNFPSVSAGWRISEESFMKPLSFINDMKVRVGIGTTGNSEIPRAFNYAYQYSPNPADAGYDIGGSNSSVQTGYALTDYGNVDTKWETSVMTNLGLDVTLLSYALTVSLDLYNKKTMDMLVRDQYTYLAGKANAPFINIGDMKNMGLDLAVNYNNKAGEFTYDVGFTFSTYKNEVLKLNEAGNARLFRANSRFGNVTVTEKGQPVSMFYGYIIDGFFENANDVANGAQHPNMDKSKPEQYVGKYKFRDVNGRNAENELTGQPDGKVDGDDQTIIGNPHPDFTGGFNLNFGFKRFDLYAYFYGSYGNDIYNYVKYWTDFNSFVGGKRVNVLTDSWVPGKTNAKLPIIDAGDNVSHRYSHSYYVEDGSFLRLRDLQLGYSIPTPASTGIQNLRIYIQGSNLLTLTKYTGLDPDVNNRITDSDGDLQKGMDWGNYPTPKIFMVGANLTF